MKLLVTGAAGFIGSALCRRLAGRAGWKIVAVDKLTYAGHLSSLAPVWDKAGFTFVKADICDGATMRDVLAAHDPDAILHLAAESHVDRSIETPSLFVQTNIVGTSVLLNAALAHYEKLASVRRAAFRFHHISTDEIYGALPPEGAFTEDTAMDPRSPYSASKASSDHLVSAWGHTYGLPVLISNCSNNYGPYQMCEKLIPLAILNAVSGSPIPVYGNGLNVRDWLFVEDHVNALLSVLTLGKPGRRYNIGGRSERTNIAVVEQICDVVTSKLGGSPRRAQILFVQDRPGHDWRYAIDPTRIEQELNWRAATDFDTGLDRTVDWYLGNESWWRPLRDAGHGTTRLGTLGKTA